MISKDQLARFVRYLNGNHLANNKIRYFSTKRKKQIMKELLAIYEINMINKIVHFVGKNKSLIDTKYNVDSKRWWLNQHWTSLPRSKATIPPIEFKKGPFILTFNGGGASSRRLGDEGAFSLP